MFSYRKDGPCRGLKIGFYASKSPLGQPHMSGNLKFDQTLMNTYFLNFLNLVF